VSFRDALVFIDGKFVKGEEAKLSVWDHGLLYGDAVFDTARVYEGNIFKLDEHLERLFDSAKGLDIAPPVDMITLKEIVVDTVKRNAISNGQIRIIITRGVGPPGIDPALCPKPSLIVSALAVPPMLGRRGLRLLTSSIRKKSPISVDSKIKSVDYIDNILAKIQAKAAGFDDAIMLDPAGCVAESTGANIFYVKKEKLFTPPTTVALEGVTRATIIDLAKELGIEVYEKQITSQDLYSADEVFLSGTGIDGLVQTIEIDGRRIGSGTWPISDRLRKAYTDIIHSKFLTPTR
jgi:branched-chain amino acid aminotransferase